MHVDVVSVNEPTVQLLHVSVAVDDAEAAALKVPNAQSVQLGCSVLDPTASVYVPATQLV